MSCTGLKCNRPPIGGGLIVCLCSREYFAAIGALEALYLGMARHLGNGVHQPHRLVALWAGGRVGSIAHNAQLNEAAARPPLGVFT